ncbi:MAG TPA: deoxyribodipyrimidine photo-lyase [Xanthomonadales bacterium]
MSEHSLVWFRQDLRIQDNPALAAAASAGLPVIALFIFAPEEEAPWSPGGASKWWLHHALSSLADELAVFGVPLVIRRGKSQDVLRALADEYHVSSVFWNRRYEPAIVERDTAIKQRLKQQGVHVQSFNGSLLFEPEQIRNQSGKPFRVFTPFWKHLRSLPVEMPVHVAEDLLIPPVSAAESESLESLGLLPSIHWDKDFYHHWDPSRKGAETALQTFIFDRVGSYKTGRDLPGVEGTSKLSPYLHWGQLGPREVWQAVQQTGAADGAGGYTFLSEIAWREFAYHLLYHFPDTPEQPLNQAYSHFPWQPDGVYLEAWQSGLTGYPIVDAGMRQLWKTGWMHNRVRMIAASFLVKHLLQPWQAGAAWFWDTLVDADLASNTMGWQWTAGCGADAAPYFRIFNPILQGEKFDPDGVYVSTWVPELKKLPARYIHQPWEAPAAVLQQAGIRLGKDYPKPVIAHQAGRERALAALSANKQINLAEQA